jgi:hypothetical protein
VVAGALEKGAKLDRPGSCRSGREAVIIILDSPLAAAMEQPCAKNVSQNEGPDDTSKCERDDGALEVIEDAANASHGRA